MKKPLVGVIMGSKSDWETMQHCVAKLEELKIFHEVEVISGHRTPDRTFEYATTAEKRGLEVVICAAGGAAHLAGMVSAKCALPILGVPMETKSLGGLDSLLSICQMPGGIPVGTLAIGKAGAVNAALLAAAILGNKHPEIQRRLHAFRKAQTDAIRKQSDPRKSK